MSEFTFWTEITLQIMFSYRRTQLLDRWLYARNSGNDAMERETAKDLQRTNNAQLELKVPSIEPEIPEGINALEERIKCA